MAQLPEEMTVPEEMVPTEAPTVPATPRDAATVALLRQGGGGMEVFLQHRVSQMAFAGGMTVFPGGGVDRRDCDVSLAWNGPDPDWWATSFGCDVSLARALVCAAVRETFEECGVLLAGPDSHTVIADASRYAEDRAALESRELSFAQFLEQRDLVLRADLLRPWSNWVTPEEEPRRYDTRFFLALLPEGQRADGSTSEASGSGWQSPGGALADWQAGRVGLLPPTWVTLTQLDECGTLDAALAAHRSIEKIIPRVVREDGRLRVVLPGDPSYDGADGHLEP
ncbi:MAG: NUDIX hydrolase [Pseudonocardiaceae bacterium]|nr:NUDIX hydrolase [Pseudonocardiaceae bacterium]